MQLFWFIFLLLISSTCFGRCFRPLSGALNCIYSFWYCPPILLPAGVTDEVELQFSYNYNYTFVSESLAVYQIMRRNMVGSDRQQMTKFHDEKTCELDAKARIKTHDRGIYYLLIFHCNNGCTKAPPYYAIRTLPVLLLTSYFTLWWHYFWLN